MVKWQKILKSDRMNAHIPFTGFMSVTVTFAEGA